MSFSLPSTGAPRTRPLPLPAASTASEPRVWTLPGLCWNASVMTSFGALPVQVLRLHDPLRVDNGAIARIAWVDKVHLDESFLKSFPDAQPVLIRAGALGPNLPSQDVLVSPEQKITVTGPGYSKMLRPARSLLGRPGVLRSPQMLLTYYLFHCGRPANVRCEGLDLHTAA